jgi:hypothetical protein
MSTQQSISLDRLTVGDFAPHKGTEFALMGDGGETLAVTLSRAEALTTNRPEGRAPFSLSFTGTPGIVLPQRIYRLSHPVMGTMEIFLVPIGATQEATEYEAVFG